MKLQVSIDKLKEELANATPLHDTPIGLIHPYWARKPLNIIEIIIKNLTKPGDLVLDPFMGSGTTIFAAAKNKRKSFGSDINPLATFIVKSIFDLTEDKLKIEQALENFLKEAESTLLPLYEIEGKRYIERERYKVEGQFENGNFQLAPIETVSKEIHKNKWTKRRVDILSTRVNASEHLNKFLTYPIDFTKLKLIPNSRIAIPEGAMLNHFFTDENIICINYLLNFLDNCNYSVEQVNACKFLLSACLPLLRLSDKKASSQWPFWRPKESLTSRNPIIVLHDKLKQIKLSVEWIKQVNLNQDEGDKNFKITSFKVENKAIQDLPQYIGTKPKLILTDPPYSDHVPYLEYSAYWNHILNFKMTEDHLRKEVVNTDAPSRKFDSSQYNDRLAESLHICSQMIDENGLIVWFYQDQKLKNWKTIYEQSVKDNLTIIDVISIKKQRRSMKTVTSPGRTLDGDLIIIFKKEEIDRKIPTKQLSVFDTSFPLSQNDSFYERYALTIKNALIKGEINFLSENHFNIKELID